MSVTEFILRLSEYFRNKGFRIPNTFEADAHKMLSKLFDYENETGEELISGMDLLDLAPFIVTFFASNETEYYEFMLEYPVFVENMEDPRILNSSDEKKKETKRRYTKASVEYSGINKEIENLEKKLRDVEKKLAILSNAPEVDTTKAEKKYKKIKDEYEEVMSDMPELIDFLETAKKGLPYLHGLMDKLSKALDRALMGHDALFQYIEWQIKTTKEADEFSSLGSIDKFEVEKKRLEARLEELKKKKEEPEKIVNELQRAYAAIEKLESMSHRKVFKGKGSVRSSYAGDFEEIKDIHFNTMTQDQKYKLHRYISDNAVDLKTRLSKSLKTSMKHKIDIAETCKAACNTEGIPMRLRYKKPKREKVKLLLFLDISGSCKAASEMMMIFTHAMKQAFPGGCNSFVFVNSLVDVSEFFNAENAEIAMKEILKVVPTKGVYSDYYTPLKQACSEHMDKINKDTIVLFLGDARNNKNDTGEEYMKMIREKARKVYFLNTEDKSRWNNNDSIIGIYEKNVDKVFEITTPKQLFECTMRI